MPEIKHSSADGGADRTPRQQRSKQIVRAIVQACRQIMDEEGVQALNTNYIAEVAGVNIASLYRWFPNKEAIIAEAFEEQVASEIDEVLVIYEAYAALADATFSDGVGMLIVDPLIERQVRFLSMHACFYQEQQPDFDVGRRSLDGRDTPLIEEASRWMAQALAEHRPALTPQQCEQRAFVATRAAQGLCLAAAIDRPDWLRQSDFRAHVQRLVMLYLEDVD